MSVDFLVIGANGQLGRDLVKVLKERSADFVGLTRADLDIRDHNKVKSVINEKRPDVIINTAAFHKVDTCEEDVQSAFDVNYFAVGNLARVCLDIEKKLVHISTDYVFDGQQEEKRYSEEDPASPINIYGASKLAGEGIIKAINPRNFVIRTAALQGLAQSSVKGSNFIETILKLGKKNGKVSVVCDQLTSPTYTPHLANAIIDLCEKTENYGIYNISGEGACSWYEFARRIFNEAKIKIDIFPISTQEASERFNYKAMRPLNTVLSKRKINEQGIIIPHWTKGLEEYMVERRKRE